MKHFRRILTAALALCMLLGISVFAAACGEETIDYTITVICSEENVLNSVKVKLRSEGGTATPAQGLTDGRAMFSLEAGEYTVELQGVSSEYTYNSASVNADKPYTTVTLTKKPDGPGSDENPDMTLPEGLNGSWENDANIVLTINGKSATLQNGIVRTNYSIIDYDSATGKITFKSNSSNTTLELTYDSANKTISGLINNNQVVLSQPQPGTRSNPFTFPEAGAKLVGSHNLTEEGWYKFTATERVKLSYSTVAGGFTLRIEEGNTEIFNSEYDTTFELQLGREYYLHVEFTTATAANFSFSEYTIDLSLVAGTWTGQDQVTTHMSYTIVITRDGTVTVNGEKAHDVEFVEYDDGIVTGWQLRCYIGEDWISMSFNADGSMGQLFTSYGDAAILAKS